MMRLFRRRRIYRVVVVLLIVGIVTWVVTVLKASSLDSMIEMDGAQFGSSLKELQRREKLCGKAGQNHRLSSKNDMDFRNFTPVRFLNNFKNPCFLQNVTSKTSQNTTITYGTRLCCLPYFIIAGFPKAGTTDLWYRLLMHPDVVAKHVKEPMFFNKGKSKHSTFADAADGYIGFYANTTNRLQRLISPAECHGPFPYHHGITGEGSVDTAYDVPDWQTLPGNEHCVEPVVTNAEYAHRLNPNMKVIFLVRNPTDRLYSDYIYESRFIAYVPSAQDFHKSVSAAVMRFRECSKETSVRSCAYNGSLETFKVRLRVGLYHIFIEDWVRVFGPNNVLLVNSDHTIGPQKLATNREILRFLQIRPLSQQEEMLYFQRGPINRRAREERDLGDMLNETRTLLDDFYRTHNEQLFKLNII